MPDRFSFRNFVEGLTSFTYYHYMYTDEPFLYLASFVGKKKVLYDEYSTALIHDAVSKGLHPEEAKSNLERVTKELNIELNHGRNIMRFMDKKAAEHKGSGKVLLFPIMCGIGKSSAIVHRIKKALESKEGESLLVMTDNNERLKEYLHPAYTPQLQEFFARQDVQDRICLFIAETKAEALRFADHSQVLLMATQRYMHLSRDELERFTSYNGKRRSMIIIDEEPAIEEYAEIKFSDLISTVAAFIQGLPYHGSSQYVSEKEWCKVYWQRIADRVSGIMQQVDRASEGKPGYYHFMRPDIQLFTNGDEEKRFMRFVREHRSDLDTYQGDSEYDSITAEI